jgi:hypothetical protein
MLDYYATPNVRESYKEMLAGDKATIHAVAASIATQIDRDDVLIPVPGDNGMMSAVCKMIAQQTGCQVQDSLRQDPAKGLVLNTLRNAHSPNNAVIIGSVDGISRNLELAKALLPQAQIKAFASVNTTASQTARKLMANVGQKSPFETLKELAFNGNDATAFAFTQLLIRDYPDRKTDIIREATANFERTSHSAFSEGLKTGFDGDLALMRAPESLNDRRAQQPQPKAPVNDTPIRRRA